MPPRNNPGRHDDGTLAGAVARRDRQAEEAKAHLEEVEAKVNSAIEWFRRVVPSHVNADQYVGLAIGELRLNPKLAAAAWDNPTSLMIALSECARLGLVPGDTYYLVPFQNRSDKSPFHWDVTGVISWQGEVDLMYRSGGVSSVHCELVRGIPGWAGEEQVKPDRFRWQPGMVLPEHEIQDDGLASDEERGPLRAVYAYARLTTGGISQVAVLNRGKVMQARSKAKTLDFWGPEWPLEGPDTANMWRKTGVHRLVDWVPHTAEFIAERLRASAAAAQPLAELPSARRPRAVPAASVTALPVGGNDTQQGSGQTGGTPGPAGPGATAPRGAARSRPPGKIANELSNEPPPDDPWAGTEAEPVPGTVVDNPGDGQ
jgi:recombination protein RecT